MELLNLSWNIMKFQDPGDLKQTGISWEGHIFKGLFVAPVAPLGEFDANLDPSTLDLGGLRLGMCGLLGFPTLEISQKHGFLPYLEKI